MPDVITALPTNVNPIYVDWPEDFYRTLSNQKNMFTINDIAYDWCFDSIVLSNFVTNEIRFTIMIDRYRSVYTMTIKDGNAVYSLIEGTEIYIRRGKNLVVLTQYFQINPVLIRYADLSTVLNKVRYCPPATSATPQFDIAKIEVWDWAGTDITKESQKAIKRLNSIQYKVISELQRDPEYCIIFDDDDHGEAADIIAIKEKDDHFAVELYHLKFSAEKNPGSRIEDFYAVCGQAQRSGIWQNPKMDLINHILTRENKRKRNPPVTRFERGDLNTLFHLKNLQRSKPFRFSVFAVQPGLSKNKVKADQLLVLGTTETYLMQAYKIPFRMIASA